MHRASASLLALGLSLLGSGMAHADKGANSALTGMCNGTMITGFENRTDLDIRHIKGSAIDFDFSGTLPTSIPRHDGIRQENGLIAPDHASWTLTQLTGDDDKGVAVLEMVMEGDEGERIPLQLVYLPKKSGGKWKPKVDKLIGNLLKVAVGVGKKDPVKIVGGSVYAINSITPVTKVKHGMTLGVSVMQTIIKDGKNRYVIEKDQYDGTFLRISTDIWDKVKNRTATREYALVILPVPDECDHAGWRVALMHYNEFIVNHDSFK